MKYRFKDRKLDYRFLQYANDLLLIIAIYSHTNKRHSYQPKNTHS